MQDTIFLKYNFFLTRVKNLIVQRIEVDRRCEYDSNHVKWGLFLTCFKCRKSKCNMTKQKRNSASVLR